MKTAAVRDTKLEQHLRARLEKGPKLLVPYVTAGLPTPQRFVQLVSDLGSVADAIEIGIPFSDPIIDGPIIQEASSRALDQGVTVKDSIRLVRDALKFSSVPLIIMSYFNPIYRAGISNFVEVAADAGVSGLIVPDLPYEESKDLDSVLARTGIAHVQLIAPMTSDERAANLAKQSSGFVYAVSRLGVTGERDRLAVTAREVVERVRPHTDLPVLLGIGITTGAQAAETTSWADGVIVGSAIMRKVLVDDLSGAVGLAKEIKESLGG